MRFLGRQATISGACCAAVGIFAATQRTGAQPPERAARTAMPLSMTELDKMIGGPTLVTLHFKEAAPKAVFDELGKQAGIEWRDSSSLWAAEHPPVTIDLDRQPFWLAMKTLSAKTGIVLDQYGSPPGYRLRKGAGDPRSSMDGLTDVSGPFLIVAHRVERSQSSSVSLSLAGPPQAGDKPQARNTQDHLSVALYVFADPKLRPLQRGTLKVEDAVDDKLNSLLRDEVMDHHVSMMGGPSATPLQVQARLKPPPEGSKRIIRLIGTLRLPLVTKSEVWEVPNILQAKDVTKNISDASTKQKYVLKEVRQNERGYEVELASSAEPLAAPDNRGQRPLSGLFGADSSSSLRLLDAEGRELFRGGFSSSGSGGGDGRTYTRSIRASFVRGRGLRGGEGEVGEPVKLVWEIPTEFKEVDVPFEFNDIPIP